MKHEHMLKQLLNIADEDWPAWQPHEHITRQQWQDTVTRIVEALRQEYERPIFGLSEVEITVCYHEPIEKFSILIAERLGLESPSRLHSAPTVTRAAAHE